MNDDFSDLIEALQVITIADQNTLFCEQLIADARQAVLDGSGSIASLTNTSVNGKSFTKMLHLSPLQVIKAATRVKTAFEQGIIESNLVVTSTIPDFSGIVQ